MTPAIAYVLKTIILPPGLNIVFALIALLLLFFKTGKAFSYLLLSLSIISLYLFSTGVFSDYLAGKVEPVHPVRIDDSVPPPGAIVVLGCGRYINPPEYDRPDLRPCTLLRVRYAVAVAGRFELPVLMSGGTSYDDGPSVAEVMGRIFEDWSGRKATWLETESRNTLENATFSTAILKENDIHHVILITQAIHMKRSEYVFKKNGLTVTAAPTYFYSAKDARPLYLKMLPTANDLSVTRMALHEMLGLIWYTLIVS